MRIYAFAVAVSAIITACSPARNPNDEWAEDDERVGIVEGSVLNEGGAPVAEAEVHLYLTGRPLGTMVPVTYASRTGKFFFAQLAWGKYGASAAKESDGHLESHRTIYDAGRSRIATLSHQRPTADVLVVVGPKAGTIIASVTDARTGAAVINAMAGVRRFDGYEYVAQSLGPLLRSLIPPDTDLDLDVTAPGYRLWRFSADANRHEKPLRLQSGERRDLQIRLWPDK